MLEAIRVIKVEAREQAQLCILNAQHAVIEVDSLERTEEYLYGLNISDNEAEIILYDIKRFLAEGIFQLEVRSGLRELPIPKRHPS